MAPCACGALIKSRPAVSAVGRGAWVAQVRGAGSVLDDDAYAELAKPSVAVPPKTYRSVAPDLFDHIRERTVSGPESHAGTAWCPPVRQAGG